MDTTFATKHTNFIKINTGPVAGPKCSPSLEQFYFIIFSFIFYICKFQPVCIEPSQFNDQRWYLLFPIHATSHPQSHLLGVVHCIYWKQDIVSPLIGQANNWTKIVFIIGLSPLACLHRLLFRTTPRLTSPKLKGKKKRKKKRKEFQR